MSKSFKEASLQLSSRKQMEKLIEYGFDDATDEDTSFQSVLDSVEIQDQNKTGVFQNMFREAIYTGMA